LVPESAGGPDSPLTGGDPGSAPQTHGGVVEPFARWRYPGSRGLVLAYGCGSAPDFDRTSPPPRVWLWAGAYPLRSQWMEPRICRTDALAMLVWDLRGAPRYVVSSAPVGGGLGVRSAVVNAQVAPGYARTDIDAHVAELASRAGVAAAGDLATSDLVAMLTAADVTDVQRADDGGVIAWSTVGIAVPTWAAAPDGARSPALPPATVAGTINIVAELPVRLTDAALVNAVATVAEAKAQALFDAGVAGTGTATDAVCLLCPVDVPADEPFGGPRSTWGARLARAVHATVAAGIPRSIARYS
jgi:adenosylcobinamide hydrolase